MGMKIIDEDETNYFTSSDLLTLSPLKHFKIISDVEAINSETKSFFNQIKQETVLLIILILQQDVRLWLLHICLNLMSLEIVY